MRIVFVREHAKFRNLRIIQGIMLNLVETIDFISKNRQIHVI